jgi:hypothetical protein
MSLDELRAHGKSTFQDTVKEIPQRSKDQLKLSIGVLLSLDSACWPKALRVSVDAFESSISSDPRDLAKEFEVSVGDARHIVNGTTFFAAMLSAHPECTPEQFVDVLQQAGIVDSAQVTVALKLAETVIAERPELTEEFEKGALGNVVLPSVRRLETSVDVRLSTSDTGVITAVPVVLMMLDTNAEGQVLWCQMSKQELNAMIAKLNRAKKDVETAETWIQSKSATVGG